MGVRGGGGGKGRRFGVVVLAKVESGCWGGEQRDRLMHHQDPAATSLKYSEENEQKCISD